MPRLLRCAALAAVLSLAACAAPPPRPDAAGGIRTERIDREFEVDAAVAVVAIDNPWGEINVRARDEREIGLHAVVQRRGPGYARPLFRARRDGDRLRLEIGFDGARAGDPAGRIDVAVYVPADLALALATRDGRIAAKRWRAPLEAASASGPILASSYDRLTVRTDSGPVRAIALGPRWSGASTLESGSGRIVLGVPTFGDIALDARTGGPLSTNFGLSVHAVPGGGREAHARYGAGRSELRVRSAGGEIVLEQLVRLGDDTNEPEDDDD